MTEPAIFLDRDGTIIEDVGVLSDPEGIRLLDDAVTALRALQEKYRLFVATNQNGIARGQVTRAQVDAVNSELGAMLRRRGIVVQQWYVCPHDRQDGCRCIKPNPTFLREAAGEYSLDLASSFAVGDHPHDAATGQDLGVFGLYLLTGHGMRHLHELPEDKLVFHTLGAAAQWILAHPHHRADLQRSIDAGAAALQRGGLVAFPTETVYGLGADAFDSQAVARIFEVKNRPLDDPLIVHVAELGQVGELVERLPDKARLLMERFWPGPLTLVAPKSGRVPDIVTAGHPTVAVRMSSNPWAQALIRQAGRLVAAPSANLFGRTSPTTADHVREQLQGRYEALIDGGACRIGIESTVVSLLDPEPAILRYGGLAKEQLEAVLGPVREAPRGGVGHADSPGMLPRHYAPRTRLTVVEDMGSFADRPDVGKLIFGSAVEGVAGPCEVLSRTGDVTEAAVNLYRALRRLDGAGLSLLVAQRVPDRGLGKAINDRLDKAAAGSGRF